VLKYWREEGRVPNSQKFWFEEQSHLNLYSELMPEPYWGDIDNNSIVFINFNPAGAEIVSHIDDSHISQRDNSDKVCGWLSPEYSKVAISFPLLADKSEHYRCYKGAEWWQKRVQWMKQFGIEDNEVKPFAIELCAWHSPKWKGGKYQSKRKQYPAINAYIKEKFGPWLERAIKGSKYKLALCVGKEFADNVIPLIWSSEKCSVWTPEIPAIDNNARKFRIFKIDGVGHIICTSAQGSNKNPSPEIFSDYEKKIYATIKSQSF
ncbi:MAG: hypothetical protein K2K05_06440, partial [Muribaculaceae bacterium]|nr:hypothetical protein [Muribaculaceae bacterium]